MKYYYEIDLKIGNILGRERSCIGKKQYKNIHLAEQAKAKHNNWSKKRHNVYPYACPYCGNYHVGQRLHVNEVKALFTHALMEDEKDMLLPIVDLWWQSGKTD